MILRPRLLGTLLTLTTTLVLLTFYVLAVPSTVAAARCCEDCATLDDAEACITTSHDEGECGGIPACHQEIEQEAYQCWYSCSPCGEPRRCVVIHLDGIPMHSSICWPA